MSQQDMTPTVTGRPGDLALPLKFTPAVGKIIAEALESGVHVETACRLAGISKPTFYSWRKLGEADGSGPLWDFVEAVKVAVARFEIGLVKQIATDPEWRAKAWMLERRHPERWGNKSAGTNVQVAVAASASAEVEASAPARPTSGELRAALAVKLGVSDLGSATVSGGRALKLVEDVDDDDIASTG